MHPTAEKVRERLGALGLDVQVRELDSSTRTAREAAEAVGCDVAQIVKSLVVVTSGGPLLCLCAGDRRLDLASLGEGARMATAEEARQTTGFSVGGVPPLGHDRPLRTVVDASLLRFRTVWCAAGTPRAVFEVETRRLVEALADAEIVEGVSLQAH